jgi:hypothetical protein
MIGFYYGCVEEPTIAPVSTPFTVAKFGNFTNNVKNVRILVDPVFNKTIPSKITVSIEEYVQDSLTVLSWSKEIPKLVQGEYSSYFDFPSGDRYLMIYDADINKVISYRLYSFISYEETTFLLSGYYSKSSTSNTFAVTTLKEGNTYIKEAAPKDSLSLYFHNLISSSPTETPKNLRIILQYSTRTDTVILKDSVVATGLAFKASVGKVFGQKDFRIIVINDTSTTSKDTLVVFPEKTYSDTQGFPISGFKYLENGYMYSYYISSDSTKKTVITELKRLPFEVRPK